MTFGLWRSVKRTYGDDMEKHSIH